MKSLGLHVVTFNISDRGEDSKIIDRFSYVVYASCHPIQAHSPLLVVNVLTLF
jgi:hypothetical protein